MATPSGVDAFLEQLEDARVVLSDDELAVDFVAIFDQPAPATGDSIAKAASTDGDLFLAAVLRLLAVQPNAIVKSHLSQPVLAVLRDRRHQDFWKRVGKDPKRDQTHEVISALQDAARQGLSEFRTAIDLRTLSSLGSARDKLMRAMSHPVVRTVVGPFVCWAENRELVQTVLRYAAECHESLDAGLFETFSRKAAELVGELDSLETSLSSSLAGFVRGVESHLSDRLDETGRLKPASVVVRDPLRRLPLDLPGQPFRLPITVANDGPGVAFGLRLAIVDSTGVDVDTTSIAFGDEFPPGVMSVDIDGRVKASDNAGTLTSSERAELLYELEWSSFSGASHRVEGVLEVSAQRPNLDWDALDLRQPYSLDAVVSPSDLYGRERVMRQLLATLVGDPVGSAFIYGQKRVGKTSLARTALSQFAASGGTAVYRDIGTINNADPVVAVDTLVDRLIADLIRERPALRDLPVPSPNGSLAPLCAFVEEAFYLAPDMKVVVALDEFDRLPVELLHRTPQSDALFTGLRSLTAMPRLGLVLIGGERMKLILSGQGVELNKFVPFQLDYIDKTTNWSDFVSLVREPVEDSLTFDDAAVDGLYEASAGNPYFAKVVLQRVYEACLEQRNAWVIRRDVDDAIAKLTSSVSGVSLVANSFSHYWEDYLLERSEEADVVTLRRRRVLLGLADALRSAQPGASAQDTAIAGSCARFQLSPDDVARELDQFRQRQILVSEGDHWTARLPLFQQWLVTRGPAEIAMTTAEMESEYAVAQRDEALRVTYEEAEVCAQRFGAFRGEHISAQKVLAYLQQFGEPADQRRVFGLLQRVSFLDSQGVYACARQAFEILQSILQARGPWSRDRIVISYTDGPGKSQQAMAREFANAARVPVGLNVLEPSRIAARLDRTDALVLIDDFVGTGENLSEGLEELFEEVPELGSAACMVAVFAIAGFDAGCRRVEDALHKLVGQRGIFKCITELSDRDRAFHREMFPDESERLATQQLARAVGERLERKAPLGYGGCEALVVFDRTTPNCSLPILWKEAGGKSPFRPLFPRRPAH